MKKLFLAICFNLIMVTSPDVFAATTELNSIDEVKARETQDARKLEPIVDTRVPTGEDKNEMDNFVKERFNNVVITKLDKDESLDGLKSIDVQHSSEYINMLKESQKSTFEKIYDNAVGNLGKKSPNQRKDIAQPYDDVYYYVNNTPATNEQKQEWQKPDFPVVNVELPNGQKILAPAKEHIPYMFDKIEILPTGLIHINETVVVIANGEKLRNGLSRSIPKYSTSRTNIRNKVDLNLISVTVNGQDIPYQAEEIGDKILLTPKQNYTLEPGIYTYQFNYILDRHLWYYDKFNEFYWDVTGSSWNLVIASAGASISLPGNQDPLSQNIILGYPGQLSSEGAFVTKGAHNTLGFAAQVPLFVGEGMHLIVSIPQSAFIPNDFNKLFSWFITDYGDIIFALFGLAAILISYIISWKYITSGNSKQKNNMRKTAPMLRYLAKGIFDKTSFATFLLELFRKNIIDIQESNDEVLLIKKTDTLTSLNRKERKALSNLFPGKESVITINAQNMLKIKRAYKLIEKNTEGKFKNLSLKLNLGYLFFSIGMLLLAEVAIAMLAVNFMQSLLIMISCTITMAFYTWILKLKFKSKIVSTLSKVFGILIIVFSMLILGVYIHIISAVIIYAMIYSIFSYTGIFAKRNGLIKNNIREAMEYKEYLIRNVANLSLGRDFLAQQANIAALEISNRFPKEPNIRDYYRLDIISKLISKI